ncbi:MAG: hypothetical protein MRJ65_13165 [Candidatus Brocadiaceae bacterium]|nr:hypothetical protein [Candidatus Brocadiaceae bacterium]
MAEMYHEAKAKELFKSGEGANITPSLYRSEALARLLSKYMEILGKLINMLETGEVDLVVLNCASLSLAARIIENKIILTDKRPFLRHTFESIKLRKYFDFSRKEKDILERRYLGR